MGGEREDRGPIPGGGTHPGLGPSTATNGSATDAPAPAPDDESPGAVDFDALHAALGAIQDVKSSIPPPAAPPTPATGTPAPAVPSIPPPDIDIPDIETSEEEIDESELTGGTPEPHASPQIAESQGRSSAQYASARPHTIPPTRAPAVNVDIPAVIVEEPPMPPPPPPLAPPPASGPHLATGAASGPHPVASPGPMHAAQPSYPHTPQAFPVQHAPTMRMADRPRRPRTPTVVVRPRGPSIPKIIGLSMLSLVVVALLTLAGFVIWKPQWVPGLAAQYAPPLPPMTATASAPPATSASAPPSAALSASPPPTTSASASSSAAPSASAKGKHPAGKAPPTGHAPPTY